LDKLNILIIDDNKADMILIKRFLEFQENFTFDLKFAESLTKGFVVLAEETIDIVLLDLSLPDGFGLNTITKFREKFPDIPVIVLTGHSDDRTAIEALRLGAQDYLVKGIFNFDLLVRSLRYSIERNKLQLALKSLAIVDELTELYNRRGFLTLADSHKKLAKRNKREFLVFFMDIDKFKTINDTLGHQEGDEALKDFADILRKTFREADIIARLGGDEFVVLVNDTKENKKEKLYTRLKNNFEQFNLNGNRKYDLSASAGIVTVEPATNNSIDEILAKADKLMYEDKMRNRG